MRTLLEEFNNKIEGLGHECSILAWSARLPHPLFVTRSKREIKTAVIKQDRVEIKEKFESSVKVGHRLTEDP